MYNWPLLSSVPSVACGSQVSCRLRRPPLTGVRQKLASASYPGEEMIDGSLELRMERQARQPAVRLPQTADFSVPHPGWSRSLFWHLATSTPFPHCYFELISLSPPPTAVCSPHTQNLTVACSLFTSYTDTCVPPGLGRASLQSDGHVPPGHMQAGLPGKTSRGA